MDKFKHIDTWVFDLDNTLYNAEDTVFPEMCALITSFIEEEFNISNNEAELMGKKYWEQYSSTLHGLMTEHNIDPHKFLNYVLDMDISNTPKCSITKEKLAHLPGRKIVFTNSSTAFTQRMLKQLDISHHFADIYTIEDAGFTPKPYIESYHNIIKKFNFDPKKACMFEDTAANLKPASELGMTTVWFYGDTQDPEKGNLPHIDYKHETLADWLLETIRKE